MREALLYIKKVVQSAVDENNIRLDNKTEQFLINFLKEKFKLDGDDEFILAEAFSKLYRKNVKALEEALNDACLAYIAKQKLDGNRIVKYS